MSLNIRRTRPTSGNKYFNTKGNGGYSTCIKGKPTDSQCDVLANCVGNACGAFNEEHGFGYEKYHLNCNAENFIERAIASGLSVYQDPMVGGIIVWRKGATLSGSDGAGHVERVLDILERDSQGHPTKIRTDSSGYGSSSPWWTSVRSKGNGNWGCNSPYAYRGCIAPEGYNPSTPVSTDPFPNVSDEELARRVWTGEFGNGNARKQALGSRYNAVQALVDKGVGKNTQPSPAPSTKLSLDEIAKKVINGAYGNYPERKTKLEAEGYNYSEVQNRVNEMLNSSNKGASNSSVNYTVQRGDTLSGIARKYGTTWQDIYNKNKTLIDSDAQRHGVRANYYNFIYAGQVLKIK